MDDPKQNVFASTASDTESVPIESGPANRQPKESEIDAPADAPGAAVSFENQSTPGINAVATPEVPHTNGAPVHGNGTAETEVDKSGEESGLSSLPSTHPGIGSPDVAPLPIEQQSQVGLPTGEPEAKKADAPPAWRKAFSTIVGSRWVLAIPAVLLAIYAEQLTEQARIGENRLSEPPLLSWQLFGLAGLLLALGIFPGKALLPSGPSAFWRGLKGMGKVPRLLFLSFLGGSVVCTAAALPLFWRINRVFALGDAGIVAQNWLTNTGSWLLYIAAMILFGLAFVVWERNIVPPEQGTEADPPLDRLPRLLEWGIMLGVFALALYLRMVNLDNMPPGLWFDEAENGVVGRSLLAPGAFHFTFIQDFTEMGALFFYFDGLMVKFFGNYVWVVRFLPALSGALIAPMLYLLGSRLYGWRIGVAAAGLVAVSSWNITFSRFGMASMPTVALDVATFLCVAQALRTGRLGYYAGAGVLVGLSLQMYYVSRLVPLILVVLLVHRLLTQHIKLIRSIRAGLVVFAVGALIAFMPMGLFAIEQSDVYNGRTDAVSIFNPANNNGNVQEALNSNIQKHLLMFNWLGDGNGRHNLPGTPMLDWITSALFFAGLASCVFRFWRWQYVFPIAWFVAALSGGVLSIPFEAPQSHRALEASVVTALLGGIFIGEAWTLLAGVDMVQRIANAFAWVRGRVQRQRVLRIPALSWPMRISWVVSAATLLVVLWLAGSLDYHKYFDVQAQDMGVWKDMYAPQAHAANVSLRYGADHDVYIAPILKGLPPSVYLAPNVQTLDWPGMQALPLDTDKTGGVIIILDLPSAADVAAFARMYPHAQFELYTAPSSPEVLIYTITIPTSDIKAVQGVRVTSAGTGPSASRVDKVVSGFTNDAASLGIKSGTVRLASTLRVDMYGAYSFDWRSNSGSPVTGQLSVDGYTASAGQTFTMGVGLHTIVVTDTVKSGDAASQLFWNVPSGLEQTLPVANLFDAKTVEAHGLNGSYMPGISGETPVQIERIDPTISFNYHETPLARPYTADWQGKLYVPEDGVYFISTEQLSTSRLFLDDQEIITNTGPNNMVQTQLPLSAGLHDIRLIFTDQQDYSHMYLYWTPPGRPHSIIPSAFLWPVMGSYPSTPGSGRWPTIDESDGSQLPDDRVTFFPPRNDHPAQDQAQGQPAQQPPSDDLRPAAPQEPAPAGKSIEPLFLLGDTDLTLAKPRAVAVDSAGNIYIFSESTSKIAKFGPDGTPITAWPVKDSAGKLLVEATSMVVHDDKVMLFDALSSDMLSFSLDGQEQGRMHLCQCFFPRAVSQAKDGNLWIADTGGNRLLKLNPDGQQQIEVLGDKGTGPGLFMEPASVWEAQDGTLYVADIGNKRVQSFTSDHKPLAQWDMGDSVARDGNRLTVDSKSDVLVTEQGTKSIVLYDKQGKELGRWFYRREGTTLVPSGIAPLGDDKFVVLFPEASLAVVFSTK